MSRQCNPEPTLFLLLLASLGWLAWLVFVSARELKKADLPQTRLPAQTKIVLAKNAVSYLYVVGVFAVLQTSCLFIVWLERGYKQYN